ncbi:MAG: hypothetical protein ACRCTZ_03040 [Sarcina sp.]
MRWLRVNDKKELQELAKVYKKNPFINLKKEIKNDLKTLIETHGYKEKKALEMFQITSGTWDGLFDRVKIFRDLMSNLNFKKESLIDISTNKESLDRDYFKSEEDEIIFYILEMEGKKRSAKLGITRKCFIDSNEAKKWRGKLALKIHPDKLKNKNAAKATAKLNQLYKEMIGDE